MWESNFRILYLKEPVSQCLDGTACGEVEPTTPELVETDRAIKDKQDGFRWLQQHSHTLPHGKYVVMKIHGCMRIGTKEVVDCREVAVDETEAL